MLAALLLAATVQTVPPAADPRTATPTPPPTCAAGTHRDEASNTCVADTVAVPPAQQAPAPGTDNAPPPSANGPVRANPLYKDRGSRQNPLANRN